MLSLMFVILKYALAILKFLTFPIFPRSHECRKIGGIIYCKLSLISSKITDKEYKLCIQVGMLFVNVL